MSNITVKFFARYAEEFGMDETTINFEPQLSIECIWLRLTDKLPPDNLLCARNMDYCALTDKVEENDEVAFFPPVSGG